MQLGDDRGGVALLTPVHRASSRGQWKHGAAPASHGCASLASTSPSNMTLPVSGRPARKRTLFEGLFGRPFADIHHQFAGPSTSLRLAPAMKHSNCSVGSQNDDGLEAGGIPERARGGPSGGATTPEGPVFGVSSRVEQSS
jgi:hypothetical protein